MSLAGELLAGSRRALARALTQVENRSPGADETLAELYPHTGQAMLIGITGAPGTGKSSLVNRMTLALRQRDRTVGILAVDPTSPFSGGAILGDRIRMRDLAGDPGVFIRSMATRGSLGGLARATADALSVLDAAGFDTLLIETVGAGQSEVDIARHAHSVIVVEAPGLGDDVQAIKAGILEIADILAVNKADDPRARNTVRALRAMLDLNGTRSTQSMVDHHGQIMEAFAPQGETTGSEQGWDVPIVETVATEGRGIDDLLATLDRHWAYLNTGGELARRNQARIAAEIDALLRDALLNRLMDTIDRERLGDLLARVTARRMAPREAVTQLVGALSESL